MTGECLYNKKDETMFNVMPKNCPFCNSDDIFILYSEDYVNVACNHCMAEGPRKDLKDSEEAIAAWNDRKMSTA